MNKLSYSYTSFTDKDKILETDILSLKEANRLDYIDFLQLSDQDKEIMFQKYMKQFEDEVKETSEVPRHWMLKDSCIREYCTTKDQVRYWVYNISDWNPADKENNIETRNLTMFVYTYFKDTKTWKYDVGFRIKLDHLWQTIINLTSLIELNDIIHNLKAPITREQINLYTWPVYIHYRNLEHPIDHNVQFVRLSDAYYEGKRNFPDDLAREFEWMNSGFCRFIVIQQYLYYNINTNKSFTIIDGDRTKNVKNIRTFFRKAIGDKKIVINMDNCNAHIHPKKRNVYTNRECTVVRTLPQYRFQVVGHYQHYWCGPKGNQIRKRKWKDAYYKNDNEDYELIKEYQNDENTSRD